MIKAVKMVGIPRAIMSFLLREIMRGIFEIPLGISGARGLFSDVCFSKFT